ncbi:organic cation transporter protein-like [Colias croceus]|uniref:organic cation transporter protein-like n=1 Tax=Colias crocea TaxID=72248 RepID=UPI001E27B972|nr:organic cation transporter protein-like [Colias croceus]
MAASPAGKRDACEAVRDVSEKWGDPLEALLATLGPFGLYQRYVVVLLLIPNLLAPMYTFNYVFVADRVPFRCVVPECEWGQPQFNNSTVEQLLPTDECRRYAPLEPDLLTCDAQDFHPNDTVPCDRFVYENHDTIYAEFGLACREWRRTLVGTVRNAALPVALILTGYTSDKWGRRTAFCIFAAFAGVLGVAKSFANSYNVYITLEFFEAALGYGFNSAAYVMMVELARPSLRAAFACATGVAYGLGGVLFAVIARYLPNWRDLLRAIHTPALLLPLYWLILDESVRWLHATQQTDKAKAVVKKAARWNTVVLDETSLNNALESNTAQNEGPKENPWLSLLKSRVLMVRFLACCFCWVAAAFVYYGLTINSVALSGDKYTNFALNMVMDIVASLLIMMALERIGRRISICVAFVLCGISSLIPILTSNATTNQSVYFMGKLSITFAFNSLYVFTAELFPTSVRSSALAATSLVGRLGSILAPQTPLLKPTIQTLLYTGCSLLAAAAVVLVPETRRAPLPQHVRQAERLRKLATPRASTTNPPPPPVPSFTRISHSS